MRTPLLAHRMWGEGDGPVLVLLHGFMGAQDDWAGVIARWEGRYRLLTVDAPGHGGSLEVPEAAYTMEGATQALAATLTAAGVERVALAGYSMGGRLALSFACRYPARCAALVLESTTAGIETAEERHARRNLDRERARELVRDFPAFLERWYRQPLFSSLARRPEVHEAMMARRRRNDPAALARSLEGMGTGAMPSLWERLPALDRPTLVLAGALDDRYVALGQRLAERIPGARRVVVPGAGHNIHAERPDAYVNHLQTFLEPLDL